MTRKVRASIVLATKEVDRVGAPEQDTLQEFAPARLISASGIKGTKEQEMRATSALLAVMSVVPSFGKNVLKAVEAPAGRITAYLETTFKTDEGGTARPDGLIVVERGKTRWSCLVEIKTGSTDLDSDQVNGYLGIAGREGIDAVLTVSNQITSASSDSPVTVDRRRLRSVRLGHMSWFRILTEAVTEFEHHGVDDPEQAYILGDLIAYLGDERSGAAGFVGMGKDWVRVRDAARNRTLRQRDPGVAEVAENWAAFVEYMALRLRQRLGRKVEPAYSKSSSFKSRVGDHAASLGDSGKLEATIKVPDAVGPIDVTADLAALQVTTSARVKAPMEGRTRTRINWLTRQLKEAPDDVRITGRFLRTSKTTSLMVNDVREDPMALVLADDPKRDLVAFDVAMTRDMGIKNGKAKGSFVHTTMSQVSSFYGVVLQNIQPWQPKAPRLKEDPDAGTEAETAPRRTEIIIPPSVSFDSWSYGIIGDK